MIENAVKHGIANSRSGGIVELTIQKSGTRLQGIVTNRSHRMLSEDEPKPTMNGTGLNNMLKRLDRLYGKNYYWQIDQSENNTFKVIFELP